MNKVLYVFGDLIDERLSRGVFTPKDSVRNIFSIALLEAQFYKHTDIRIEMPHLTIPKADLFIHNRDSHTTTFFEFKYDRLFPQGLNIYSCSNPIGVNKSQYYLGGVHGNQKT